MARNPRCGPKTRYPDAELTGHIRRDIETSSFNVEEPRRVLHAWFKIYKEQWLMERHGHRSPAAKRREWLAPKKAT